jgi:heme-degrading monooxygenase HmoA
MPIMRIWRGEVRTDRATEYLARMTPAAMADYRSVPGNRGAWVLSRRKGAVTEVATLSLWSSLESIRAFAGEDLDRAKYYDFDPAYLLSLPETVEHWEVLAEPAQ